MTPGVILLAALLQQAPAPRAPVQDEVASAPAHIASGLVLYRKRRFRAAAGEFRKAVEADPASAAAEYYLGYSLYKVAEPTRRLTPEKQEAREHFARAFELDPQFRPSWTSP